jgi:hypothetical protein
MFFFGFSPLLSSLSLNIIMTSKHTSSFLDENTSPPPTDDVFCVVSGPWKMNCMTRVAIEQAGGGGGAKYLPAPYPFFFLNYEMGGARKPI